MTIINAVIITTTIVIMIRFNSSPAAAHFVAIRSSEQKSRRDNRYSDRTHALPSGVKLKAGSVHAVTGVYREPLYRRAYSPYRSWDSQRGTAFGREDSQVPSRGMIRVRCTSGFRIQLRYLGRSVQRSREMLTGQQQTFSVPYGRPHRLGVLGRAAGCSFACVTDWIRTNLEYNAATSYEP